MSEFWIWVYHAELVARRNPHGGTGQRLYAFDADHAEQLLVALYPGAHGWYGHTLVVNPE